MISLQHVKKIAAVFNELNYEFVFVGGSILPLLVPVANKTEIRPTKDIDLCIAINTYSEYNALCDNLKNYGIHPAINEKVTYRFTFNNTLIDIIPSHFQGLGPTNKWLKFGFEYFKKVVLDNVEIKLLKPSIFLASKWEAFSSRGGDLRFSHDIEDIVFVLAKSENLLEDIKSTPIECQEFIRQMGNELLANGSLIEIIEGHLGFEKLLAQREHVINLLKQLTE